MNNVTVFINQLLDRGVSLDEINNLLAKIKLPTKVVEPETKGEYMYQRCRLSYTERKICDIMVSLGGRVRTARDIYLIWYESDWRGSKGINAINYNLSYGPRSLIRRGIVKKSGGGYELI